MVMMARLNGRPVRSIDGDRTIWLRKGSASLSEFVYSPISTVPTISVLRHVSANRATFTHGNFRPGASSNKISAGESNELSMEPLILLVQLFRPRAIALALRVSYLERLQVLAGLEAYRLTGRDIHFRTGSRVSADTGLPWLYREHAKAPQFNPI